MLYTATATKRILERSLDVTTIVSVRELANVVVVAYRLRGVRGTCSTFISKTSYQVEFESYRKSSAGSIVTIAGKDSNSFVVFGSDTQYQVSVSAEGTFCECRDHVQQVEYFDSPMVACKHVYAVLQEFNCSTLADYIHRQQQLAA